MVRSKKKQQEEEEEEEEEDEGVPLVKGSPEPDDVSDDLDAEPAMDGTERGRPIMQPPIDGESQWDQWRQAEREKHALPKGLPRDCTDRQIRNSAARGEIWMTLFYAVIEEWPEFVKRIIALGISVDVMIPEGMRNPYGAFWNDGPFIRMWLSPSALHIALIYHREDMARLLVESGANSMYPMYTTVKFRMSRRIYKWEYNLPLNHVLLNDFSESFFLWFHRQVVKKLSADTGKPGSEPDRWRPLIALARFANNHFHYDRLNLILTNPRFERHQKVTLEHLKVAAGGAFPLRTNRITRNAVRERILNRLILETGGGYEGNKFATLMQNLKGDPTIRKSEKNLNLVTRLRRLKAKRVETIPTKRKSRCGIENRHETVIPIVHNDKDQWRRMQRQWRHPNVKHGEEEGGEEWEDEDGVGEDEPLIQKTKRRVKVDDEEDEVGEDEPLIQKTKRRVKVVEEEEE
ncbi:hypothetical protein BZA05DRAFT_145545 [Tricharina praecox]|uniref:uncharacterized protein n=1 Tax=Tricharina praecox TaxID=43433 RepID=UPI00222063F5|nr:uncharacterized protein BZA05DRAFT_145545 [Tricharina praecox]KAI5845465.1 hypothetical protein BZA05DRAFT_145545 [Tricharina praecox]